VKKASLKIPRPSKSTKGSQIKRGRIKIIPKNSPIEKLVKIINFFLIRDLLKLLPRGSHGKLKPGFSAF